MPFTFADKANVPVYIGSDVQADVINHILHGNPDKILLECVAGAGVREGFALQLLCSSSSAPSPSPPVLQLHRSSSIAPAPSLQRHRSNTSAPAPSLQLHRSNASAPAPSLQLHRSSSIAPTPVLQHQHTSAPAHISTSTHQHQHTSAPAHISASTHQHPRTSAPAHISSRTHRHQHTWFFVAVFCNFSAFFACARAWNFALEKNKKTTTTINKK